jgi:ATP-dependent DNA ligase
MTAMVFPVVADLLATISPMLADTSDVPIDSLGSHWMFEEKVDGIRALASWDGHRLTLRNRNGRDITASYPDLVATAGGSLATGIIIDGEIVAQSGSFQDVQWRDKRPLAQVADAPKRVPVIFKAFDLLHQGSDDLRHLTYSKRRGMLVHAVGGAWNWQIVLSKGDPAFYEEIRAAGGEGVIAKRVDGRYHGGRSKDWLKYKSKHTVTCIGHGYEPGKGAREHFGALLLCMIQGDPADPKSLKAVPVGKVGSGFTLPQTREMQAILDAPKESLKLPIVEVECLGKTKDNLLRQPIYLGVRTDATMLDARYSQLNNLPTT